MRQYTLLATAVILAVACGDDPPTGPGGGMTAQMRADVAQSSGEAIAQNTEAMARTEATASSSLFAFGGDPSAGNCSITLGNLLCVTSFGSLDGQAEITFRDAGSAEQEEYDAETTASISIETDWDGEINRSGFNIDLMGNGAFSVTGLTGTEANRTWNGTSNIAVTSSTHGGNRTYEWTSTTTWASVVVAASGTEPRWPSSGTVTSNVQLEVLDGPDDGRTASTTVEVTFNGTANVPLKVGNTEYRLDLASRTVTDN